MPELPEVEIIVRRLQPLVVGKTIEQIKINKEKSFIGDPESIIGAQIRDVSRRSKIIRFHLNKSMSLLAHLKMTGQFIYVDESHRVGGGHPTADWVQQLPSKHTRVQFELSDAAQLFFNDQRIFGWIKIVPDEELQSHYKNLGPDIIDPAVTSEYLQEKFAKRTRAIKLTIMDNAVVCGVGNIYACDALNVARIDPRKPTQSLSPLEIEELLNAMLQVINEGIQLGGATISDYRDVSGFSGGYQDVVRVYKRAGESCKNCPGIIQKMQLGGRGTFFCPRCQN